MKHWCLGACLVLGGGGLAVAQEDDSVAAVMNDYYALQRANAAKQQKNPPAKGVSLPLVSEAELVGFIDRCWKIYDASSGEPAEFDALNQILTFGATGGAKLEEHWSEAAQKLFAGFLDDDRMANFAMRVPAPQKYAKEANAYVEDLKAKSKSLNVKAAFAYKALQEDLNKYSNDQLNDAQLKALATKLTELAKQYGPQEVPYRGVTYADFAKNTIYAMENLKIGGVAPEIAANDLDGVAFKLSDYRGKVVMLDFWGYW